MITIKQLEERVQKARRHVILDVPMAQGSAVKMGLFFSDKIQTAATDGKSIGFNPPFVASLSEEELEFVVVHEWGHKMLRHFARCLKIRSSFGNAWTSFHEDILNEAADEEDNYLIESAGFKILEGSCRDKRFDGMPMEETFQILLHERKQPEPKQEEQPSDDGEEEQQDGVSEGEEEEESESDGSQGTGDGDEEQCDGEDTDGPSQDGGQGAPRGDDGFGQNGLDQSASLSDEEVDDYKRPDVKDWGKIHTKDNPTTSEIYEEEADSRAEHSNDLAVAKLSGKLPENVERILKDLKDKSDVDWVSEMADFMSDACGEDIDMSWRRPNKRFAFMDIYLPSQIKQGVGEITVLIDSSGSMDQKMYEAAASETAYLITDAAPDKANVVEFTTRVISHSSYEDGVEIDSMPDRQSWGGTDVCVGFDWVYEHAPETTAIVVISDMEFFAWPEDTGIPVLWVKVPPAEDNTWYFGKPSFGKMITVR